MSVKKSSKKFEEKDRELSKNEFAALLWKIIIKCYPNNKDREGILFKDAKYIYGINLLNKPDDLARSIKGIMDNSGKCSNGINAVALEAYVCELGEQHPYVLVKDNHYQEYMRFVELQIQQDLTTLAEQLKSQNEIFPPEGIKYFASIKHPEAPPPVEIDHYDLFISAPIKSLEGYFDEKKKTHERLKNSLGYSLDDYAQGHNLEDDMDFQNLKRTLIGKLTAGLFDSLHQNLDFEVENFQIEVRSLQDKIEAEGIKTYFALSKDREEHFKHRNSKDALREERTALHNSKAFLLVLPQWHLPTAAYVILGWAMEQQKPIFLVYYSEESLTHLLRGIGDPNFEIFSLQVFKCSISEVYVKLVHNTKWQSLFHSDTS